MSKQVLFSVAHSKVAPGVVSPTAHILEYMVSLRASLAAFRNLCGEFSVELVDCGPMGPAEYSVEKVETVNGCAPLLAIEIHCNGSTNPAASYVETIYHPSSPIYGKAAADAICTALKQGYSQNHSGWPVKGSRANSLQQDLHWDFFLAKTKVPAVIVEGLFLTNLDQEAWISGGDMSSGPEAYGLLVAEGVRNYLHALQNGTLAALARG